MGSEQKVRSRARRRISIALAVSVGVAGAVVWFTGGHDPLVRPDDVCATRPPLRNVDGVRLQPAAMKAYRHAQRQADGHIDVRSSYRSCREQAKACRGLCGNANGCPGTCASPGASYHQLGAAIDITQESLDARGVIGALQRTGWCESQPDTDPGHFSFAGCH